MTDAIPPLNRDALNYLYALLGCDSVSEAAAVWEHNPVERKQAYAAISAYLRAAKGTEPVEIEQERVALGDLGFELAAFHPGQVVLKDAGITEYVFEDCAYTAKPVVPGVYHTCDWMVAFDGHLVGIQFWDIHRPIGSYHASPAPAERDAVLEEENAAQQDLGARVSAAFNRLMETGWLVERRGQTSFMVRGPVWWRLGGDDEPDWTSDSFAALRFARREDAEAYILESGWTEAFASEHEWSDENAVSPAILTALDEARRALETCAARFDRGDGGPNLIPFHELSTELAHRQAAARFALAAINAIGRE